MGSDPCAAMEDLDCGRRVARIQMLPDELIRHAVVMPFDLDVIIDIRSDGLPMRDDIAFDGQRFQRRAVELVE